ncbi:unnamed protein product, partial [Polarella glacialis]
VHLMLRSAASGDSSVNEACVTPEAAEAWKISFQAAVDTMLQKTKRTMQLGLGSVAQGVQKLVEGSSCGQLESLVKLKGQAMRLQVLASTRSLADLDPKVKYEPLKALTVGGVDVHLELNAFIMAWQMMKGPEEVGRTLAKFLDDFREEAEELPSSAGAPASTPEPAKQAAGWAGGAQREPLFWVTAMNEALSKLGDHSHPVSQDCISSDVASSQANRLDEAFGRMMEKNRRGMQAGLKSLASGTQALMDQLGEASCGGSLQTSAGAKRLRSASSRLASLSAARSLLNFGTHVEYEAKQALRVGGIDVHV